MTGKEAQNLVLLELMSPSQYEGRTLLPKEESDAIYKRWTEYQHDEKQDWDYLFEPIKDEGFRNKMIQLYKTLDNDNEG